MKKEKMMLKPKKYPKKIYMSNSMALNNKFTIKDDEKKRTNNLNKM